MKRANAKSKFDSSTIASPRQVRGFSPDEGRCCDATSFCLELTATPGSKWNQSAVKVFVEDFIRVGLFECTNRRQIAEVFTRHFRTIQRHYREHGTIEPGQHTISGSRNQGASSDHSRAQRRYMLFQRRYSTALRYTRTRAHVHILRRLGVEGMSSDEEDTGAPYTRYRIRRRVWRSTAATLFLRILDALHRRRRSRSGQGSRRGAPPRLRYASTDVSSESAPVRGLPRSAYDAAWLASRSALQLEELCIDEDHDYNFNHDPEVVRSVFASNSSVL
ncbi:hypothetical protein BV20DRAFT_958765 [Pilatotrama ljubarskyi]|nr:hypothetical protein BV20DRAFT_958765 [Pilatotrama ljubarskyi]